MELECAATPPMRVNSAENHLMNAQLGWAETSGEVLTFSTKVTIDFLRCTEKLDSLSAPR